MFGQVLDKLDSWVGRSFVLVSYFPFLVFVVANIVMAQATAPGILQHALAGLPTDVFGQAGATLVLLVAAAALAYVLDPVFGEATRFLEGAYFPRWMTGWLATDQMRQVRDLADEEERTGRILADIAGRKEAIAGELMAARARGVAIGAMRDMTLVRVAGERIATLDAKQDQQRSIVLAELEAAAAALIEAFAANCANESRLAPGAGRAEVDAARTLHLLDSSMLRLVEYAHDKAQNDYSRIVDERQTRFAGHELPSTVFGNQAAALRGFLDTRFNIDFDFVWPIVQIVVSADQKTTDAIVNSKQRLDFCVRLLAYTVLFTAAWLIVLGLSGHSETAAIALGTGGFAASAAWLAIVHASYRSFAELVRSVVVLKRFEVLKALHLGLPQTWKDEKDLWGRIGTQLKWGSAADITYEHTK